MKNAAPKIVLGSALAALAVFMFWPRKAAAATSGAGSGGAGALDTGSNAAGMPPAFVETMEAPVRVYNHVTEPGKYPNDLGEQYDGYNEAVIRQRFNEIKNSNATWKNKYDWTDDLQRLAARVREQSFGKLPVEDELQAYKDEIHDAAYPGVVAKSAGTVVGTLVTGVVSVAGGAAVAPAAGSAASTFTGSIFN